MRITINELRKTIRKLIVEAKMTQEEIANLGQLLASPEPDEETIRSAIELGLSLKLLRVIKDELQDGRYQKITIRPYRKLKKWVLANRPKGGTFDSSGKIYIHEKGDISYLWIHERPDGYYDPHSQGALRS